MYTWHKYIQMVVDTIDETIQRGLDDSLALDKLAKYLGYSKFYTSKKFKKLSGMTFRTYVQKGSLLFLYWKYGIPIVHCYRLLWIMVSLLMRLLLELLKQPMALHLENIERILVPLCFVQKFILLTDTSLTYERWA